MEKQVSLFFQLADEYEKLCQGMETQTKFEQFLNNL